MDSYTLKFKPSVTAPLKGISLKQRSAPGISRIEMSNRNEIKHVCWGLVSYKLMFEICKNTAMSCHFEQTCDIRIMTGMCSRNMHFSMGNSFFVFLLFPGFVEEQSSMRSSNTKQKLLLLHSYLLSNRTKPADGSACTLSAFPGPLPCHLCFQSPLKFDLYWLAVATGVRG